MWEWGGLGGEEGRRSNFGWDVKTNKRECLVPLLWHYYFKGCGTVRTYDLADGRKSLGAGL